MMPHRPPAYDWERLRCSAFKPNAAQSGSPALTTTSLALAPGAPFRAGRCFLKVVAGGLLLAITSCGAPAVAESDWAFVWGDDFDRESLGSEWQVRVAKAELASGRLHLQGHGVTVLTERGFAHDVRLEYDAQQDPGVPPVDLSSTTGASSIFGWGHLHSLGLNDLTPDDPGFHRTYRMVVEKEGRRIRFWVDDKLVHEETPEEMLGGPGMDRVGFVTWGGMFVDNLKVYERTTRHPDGPKFPRELPAGPLARKGRELVIREDVSANVTNAVQAFNRGRLDQALEGFRREESSAGCLGEAYVLGDLAYQEPFHHPEFERLAERFAAVQKRFPEEIPIARVEAAREFAQLKMRRLRTARTAVLRLTGVGEANNPFYHKAWLYLARYHYWNGMEGGRGEMLQQARTWMMDLRKLWPDQPVLRQYTGESVPWGADLNADPGWHPAWAAYLREAFARNIAIMETFFRERQTPDGQLHGGWGDDVELLRTWMQIAAISSAAEPVRQGIERLSEGVWNHVLKDGYGGFSDVEHSSEDSADSIPGMLFLRYGDPLWVERNLQSCRRIKDTYMGIDDRGYPRFRSSYFGGDRVDGKLQDGGDVGYCSRPMKHFLWAAWQGNHTARDWFVRWADGWRAATMGTEAGKLPGVAPLAIWHPSGSIQPPSPDRAWHDPLINRWAHAPMMHDAILAGYWLSQDPRFLQPWQKMMEWASRGPLGRDEGERGSVEWQIAQTSHLPANNPAEQNRAALYRWLSGDSVYDEYIRRAGGGAVFGYRLDGDLDTYMKSFEKAAKRLRNNLELQTTEVLSTDRAALPHALDIFGAYTGAITGMRDAATPTFSVTYDTPSTDFAALLVVATEERIRIWLYQFEDEPMPIGLQLWRLKPGRYDLLQGEQHPGEHEYQHRYAWRPAETFTLQRRAEGPTVVVPPGKVWVVDLRLVEPLTVPAASPDLAIAPRDITKENDELAVRIHNIGNAGSLPTKVALQARRGEGWTTIASGTVPAIDPPEDLRARLVAVRLPQPRIRPFRVVVDPRDAQFETNEQNNNVTMVE